MELKGDIKRHHYGENGKKLVYSGTVDFNNTYCSLYASRLDLHSAGSNTY